MNVEVKLTGRKDVPANERQSVHVETHSRRGDVFNVERIDTMAENDTAIFTVPAGGRLVVQMPEGGSEIVYDAAQGAAVRKDSQVNTEGKADSAVKVPEVSKPVERNLGQPHQTPQPHQTQKPVQAQQEGKK